MCGITGFITYPSHNKDTALARLRRMTDTLAHRGPDAEGFYVDEHAALGHRRLSIIDVSSGSQPMVTQDGALQIVFNGEIYNFPELRTELENLGHRFQTRSDTEVILLGYRQWGKAVVSRLNGMFAFAIWEKRERKLFLARDRVGKKPLYWHWDGRTFSFASELKALYVGDFFDREIDPRSMDAYFCLGYIPAPLTIFKNVQKLEPAASLSVTRDGVRTKTYWELDFSRPRDISMPEAVEEFETLLDNATRCRLMSEVPLGAFLSGGLDSTLVVSSMAKSLNKPVLTNSIGFNEKEFSELPIARAVAGHLGTDHREFTVAPNAQDAIRQISNFFDEPFADSSAVPTWYVCKMARENVTVALSGDGGDESFGGYTFRYIPHLMESNIRNWMPTWFRTAVFGALGACYPASTRLPRPLRLKTYLENLAASDGQAFYMDLSWLRAQTRETLYSDDFKHELAGFHPMELVLPKYTGSNAPDAVGKSQHADIRFYMTEDVLVKVDRMSMANSLEVRAPLLDYRILEFAAKLPARLKISKRQGKLVLRELARKRLPNDVLDQPKRGFSIPAAKWLRTDLRPMVEDVVSNPAGLVNNYLTPTFLRAMWKEHQTGARDHSVFFWGLMMLGLWEQHWG